MRSWKPRAVCAPRVGEPGRETAWWSGRLGEVRASAFIGRVDCGEIGTVRDACAWKPNRLLIRDPIVEELASRSTALACTVSFGDAGLTGGIACVGDLGGWYGPRCDPVCFFEGVAAEFGPMRLGDRSVDAPGDPGRVAPVCNAWLACARNGDA